MFPLLASLVLGCGSTAPDTREAPADAPVTSAEQADDGVLRCSFCGKSQHEVRKLIAGPSVYICDECVELCSEIIAQEQPPDE